jgi:hypothetical protein
MAYIAMPLGTALGGVVLEKFDVRGVLVVLGVLYIGAILVAMVTPAMREMNLRLPHAAQADAAD